MSKRSRSRSRGLGHIVGILLMIGIVVGAVSGYYIFYKGFFHESKKNANMDMPQISLSGPTTGAQGDKVPLSIKNSGNTDFLTWGFVEGSTVNGGSLLVGDQASCSAILCGPGPWVFKIQAQTSSGKVIEDSWAVEIP